MIRPTEPGDTLILLHLARGTGVFKPTELVALAEVLDDYHAKERARGHVAVTVEHEGTPVGFAYYAPSALAERLWYLYWIAVDVRAQGQGLGSRLMTYAEDDTRRQLGRLFLIETSSLPHYEPTRRFYRNLGFHQASVLTDFYADGDDMVIFAKRLTPKGVS